MLSKNIDHAVVGHNFFAYLYSSLLLRRGLSVMLLDDERFNYGDFYTETITELDLLNLKSFGENLDINCFKNIENYLTRKEHFFFLSKRRVLLGASPKENLKELARKFPEFFLDLEKKYGDKINESFRQGLVKCTDAVFSDKKWSGKKPFHPYFDEVILDIANTLTEMLAHDHLEFREKNYLFTLINMVRGFHQGILSSRGNKNEIFHTILCLLSPLYELDHDRLKNDLQEYFKKSGGEFKKLNFNELKFQSGSLQSFKLESFEGHIKAKKMSFVGGSGRELPLDVIPDGKIFSCLKGKVSISFKNPENQKRIFDYFKSTNILFSSTHKVGTDRPFWFGAFHEDHFDVTFIVSFRMGSKEDFFSDQLEDLINEDFNFIYPEIDGVLKLSDLKFSNDELIEDRSFEMGLSLKSVIPRKILRFINRKGPNFLDPLRNVYYLGPLNSDRLGTYSSLLLLKKYGNKI